MKSGGMLIQKSAGLKMQLTAEQFAYRAFHARETRIIGLQLASPRVHFFARKSCLLSRHRLNDQPVSFFCAARGSRDMPALQRAIPPHCRRPSDTSPSANAVMPALIARVTALTCSLVIAIGTDGFAMSSCARPSTSALQLRERHHAIDEAHLLRFLWTETAARHHQLLRHRGTDLAYQLGDAAPRERKADDRLQE